MLIFKASDSFPAIFEKTLQRKCNVLHNFINIELTPKEQENLSADSASGKKKEHKVKKQIKSNDDSHDWSKDLNCYKHYVEQFPEYGVTNQIPKHQYTIHLHRAVYNDELYEVYRKYEKHVHDRHRTTDEFRSYHCNSPLYDPVMEPEKAEASMLGDPKLIDFTYHHWKDEGHCPIVRGSYCMYHRIDGKLVAAGFFDLSSRYFDSAYFIYDPEFKFLNLGVVGAIRELEFCRKIKQTDYPELEYYQLGDMVPDCPKVNYKCNYQPGLLLCPCTKQHVSYEKCRETI